MKFLTLSDIVNTSLVCLLLAVSTYSAVVIVRTNREYGRFFERERIFEEKIAVAREEVKSKAEHLGRLRSSPRYLERVIRMRLGYARSNEYIFHFESE